MAAALEQTKAKRRWGKSRHREKITIVDRMEIEETLQKFASEVKERHSVAPSPDQEKEETVDLQQPELMTDFALVEALKKIKVPIPVYSDGTPSRERLLYLFRQHVLPRPQRARRGRRLSGRRRERIGRRVDGQAEAMASCKLDDPQRESMEVDEAEGSNDHWALRSDGTWKLPLQRKR